MSRGESSEGVGKPAWSARPGRVSSSELEDLRRRLLREVRRICPRWFSANAEDIVQVAMLRKQAEARKRELRMDDDGTLDDRQTGPGPCPDESEIRHRARSVPPRGQFVLGWSAVASETFFVGVQ